MMPEIEPGTTGASPEVNTNYTYNSMNTELVVLGAEVTNQTYVGPEAASRKLQWWGNSWRLSLMRMRLHASAGFRANVKRPLFRSNSKQNRVLFSGDKDSEKCFATFKERLADVSAKNKKPLISLLSPTCGTDAIYIDATDSDKKLPPMVGSLAQGWIMGTVAAEGSTKEYGVEKEAESLPTIEAGRLVWVAASAGTGANKEDLGQQTVKHEEVGHWRNELGPDWKRIDHGLRRPRHYGREGLPLIWSMHFAAPQMRSNSSLKEGKWLGSIDSRDMQGTTLNSRWWLEMGSLVYCKR
eukprot:scaffold3906_cov64-Attheya_sp.AAC.2